MEGQNYFGLSHDLCLQKTCDKQYNNLIMYVFAMVYYIDIFKLSPVKWTPFKMYTVQYKYKFKYNKHNLIYKETLIDIVDLLIFKMQKVIS